MATLVDTYASADALSYTLPTVQDADTLVVMVNRDPSFSVSYTPTSFLTSLTGSVGGVSFWYRTLASGDTGTTLARANGANDAAWYAAWVVRGLDPTVNQVTFGSEDNFSSVSFPRTISDSNAQGTPPYPSGVFLSAGFGFYSPTTGSPGTYGEVRLVSIDGYTADANVTHEFLTTVPRNESHFTAAISDMGGNTAAIDWTYTVSVGGPRTRLEVARIIFEGELQPYWGILAQPA